MKILFLISFLFVLIGSGANACSIIDSAPVFAEIVSETSQTSQNSCESEVCDFEWDDESSALFFLINESRLARNTASLLLDIYHGIYLKIESRPPRTLAI